MTTSVPNLMNVFDFNVEDLAANHEGLFTEQQIIQLKKKRRDTERQAMRQLLIYSPLVLLFCLAILYAVESLPIPIRLVLAALVLLGALPALRPFWRRIQKLNRDIKSQEVLVIEGIAKADHYTTGGDGIRWRKPSVLNTALHIGDVWLEIDGRSFTLLGESDHRLRVYFSAHAKQILSVEALELEPSR
jgi:hypothetical protein